MGRPTTFLIILFSVMMLSMDISCRANDEDRKLSTLFPHEQSFCPFFDYIVYMGCLPEITNSLSATHNNMLEQIVENGDPSRFLIRSYKRSFNGFVAKLTNQEAQKLAGMDQVISVFPDRIYQLRTTRSWDYMGFYENTTRNLTGESDVIIGILDSGVWPESESFGDTGFGPPPKKWKGACEGGKNFTCNNKLIGARVYTKEDPNPSARDFQGHGTHTASIAAGNILQQASFYGLAQGTTRGAVPSARIAAYKVCWLQCEVSNILAAFDDAIADGVDIISTSLGFAPSDSLIRLDHDPIAIGSFHAMAKGIVTAQAVGNFGPKLGSLSDDAPWVLSVAASNMDRQFIDKVILGNGKTLVGLSINPFPSITKDVPLVYGSQVSNSCAPIHARKCANGCLDRNKVEGKIVLCEAIDGIDEAFAKGALGAIMLNDIKLPDDMEWVVPLPSLVLSTEAYSEVYSYYNSNMNPRGRILKSEAKYNPVCPRPASYSARGPSLRIPDIMKPDITAPGTAILAAYSPLAPPKQVKFYIDSGTSVSCPHAAGVAAYIKAFHPDWSPSAIKSAIMTTAWQMEATSNEALEFAFGSGHLNPLKAINPGLVYEIFKDDYVKLLCSLGYNISKIDEANDTCLEVVAKIAPKDLNYPSMMAIVSTEKSFEIVFNRTVTNVGIANSSYKANLIGNSKLKIQVIPTILEFESLKETKSFIVKVAGGGLPIGVIESGSLEWSDGVHSVRSPIIIHTLHSG